MPTPRWFDPGDELDSPAIVLDLIDADNLLVVARSTDTDTHGQLIEPLAQAAASVHTFDLDQLPAHLDRPSAWDAYIDSRIQRWIDAEAAHVEPIPIMRLIAAWLDDNRPTPAPFTLVHGDFQVANVLVDRGDRSFLLVDWELTHVGDPREDLGWWALASVTQPPDLIAAAADDFYPRYRELTGLSEEQVNPATVAYFTVLASDSVFINVIEQLAGVARGETTNMTITYMSNAVAGMHDVFMNAMAAHDALQAGAA
jgi:aminoglycoside phosphotransferase (APT) family kinase protein